MISLQLDPNLLLLKPLPWRGVPNSDSVFYESIHSTFFIVPVTHVVGPVVNPKAVDTPSDFIRRSRRLAKIARCAQYGDCDFRRSPRLAFKIADIWSTRYRRLNSPAFAKSARPRDFLSFLLRVAGKINQSSWAVLWQWLFKMAEGIDNCFWTEEKEINLIILWSEKPCLFDVLPSGYSNRLKKDSAFQ